MSPLIHRYRETRQHWRIILGVHLGELLGGVGGYLIAPSNGVVLFTIKAVAVGAVTGYVAAIAWHILFHIETNWYLAMVLGIFHLFFPFIVLFAALTLVS